MYLADLHCDTISRLRNEGILGRDTLLDNSFHVDLRRLRESGYLLQHFAIFTDAGVEEDTFAACMEMIAQYHSALTQYADWIAPLLTPSDFYQNRRAGKLSAVLTIEDGGCIGKRLELLPELKRLGVRMITLTWNYPNAIGYPATPAGVYAGQEAIFAECGLTEYGFSFIEEMERLGLYIDISHLSDAGAYDVLKQTNSPVIASHSNARSLCKNKRNITDALIRQIAERGGVIGINFEPKFLHNSAGAKDCGIAQIIKHIKHLYKCGGIGCIALGTDFDGIAGNPEITEVSAMVRLVDAIRKAGFCEAEVEAICYRNIIRLYQ